MSAFAEFMANVAYAQAWVALVLSLVGLWVVAFLALSRAVARQREGEQR